LSPYERFDDPYCYPNSRVLKNRADIQSPDSLETFEVRSTTLRACEPLPNGTLDTGHYRAIHHHLFQDVYEWAGEYRTIRIAKNEAMFCYPEHIAEQMGVLFEQLRGASFTLGIATKDFVAAAASFLADLNAIHPFREGNGRTQLTFLFLLCERAGHKLDMTRVRAVPMLDAMVASFKGRLESLENEISLLLI
jgi:cell filamentation protein